MWSLTTVLSLQKPVEIRYPFQDHTKTMTRVASKFGRPQYRKFQRNGELEGSEDRRVEVKRSMLIESGVSCALMSVMCISISQ